MSVVTKFDSGLGAGNDRFVERRYLIGSTSDNDAYTELLAHADCPDTLVTPFATLARTSIKLDHVGANNYEASCRWGSPSASVDPTYVDVQFSTMGGTKKITQSLATTRYPATTAVVSGKTLYAAPDHFGQIGVTKDGVEGVDVPVPTFTWSETHVISSSTATAAYRRTLTTLTGKVNNASFRDFNEGEVLFLGAQGQRTSIDSWSVTFSFAASPNATGLSVGLITGINKEGWQYLWKRMRDDEIESTAGEKWKVSMPVAVYVETVHQKVDFADLGIPT